MGRTRLRSEWHPDVEVTLQAYDLKCHDEKHEQLEHDVNHRCHLQFDFVTVGILISNFHNSVGNVFSDAERKFFKRVFLADLN